MFVSSIATLGDLPPHEKFITEKRNGIRTSHNDYAISKYGAEMEVARTTRRFNVIIINPGVIIGPVLRIPIGKR
jgi:nucleoside-diphosphate-sugar epimerase